MNTAPVIPVSPTEPISDPEIVRRVLAGETSLFEVLMRRHNQRVFRAARAIVKEDDEAEDVMQDAYVRAYAALTTFEHRALFSTWVTRIAVHEALARVRRRRRFDLFDPSDGSDLETGTTMADTTRDPEQHASDVELTALVEAAIDELPDGFRVVFILRAVEGLTPTETAECLGIPEETVKTRLHRARAQLRRSLRARADGALPMAFSFHLTRCDRVVERVLARIAPSLPNA